MFMFDVLSALAVRREERLTVIQEQNDEVLEVLFFVKGSYAAGFVLNRVPKFCMKFVNPKNSNVINAFACTYHLRSDWIYKTITVCEGFSIRKRDWQMMLKSHPQIVDELNDQVRKEYIKYIEQPLTKRRAEQIERIKERADYHHIEGLWGKRGGDPTQQDMNVLDHPSNQITNMPTSNIEPVMNAEISFKDILVLMDDNHKKFKKLRRA